MSAQAQGGRGRFLRDSAFSVVRTVSFRDREWGKALRARLFLHAWEQCSGRRAGKELHKLSREAIDAVEVVFMSFYEGNGG